MFENDETRVGASVCSQGRQDRTFEHRIRRGSRINSRVALSGGASRRLDRIWTVLPPRFASTRTVQAKAT